MGTQYASSKNYGYPAQYIKLSIGHDGDSNIISGLSDGFSGAWTHTHCDSEAKGLLPPQPIGTSSF